MVRCDTKLFDGITMLLGWIALVGNPVILWIFLCQLIHIIVTIGLGENGGCRNGKILGITLYNGCMGKGDRSGLRGERLEPIGE